MVVWWSLGHRMKTIVVQSLNRDKSVFRGCVEFHLASMPFLARLKASKPSEGSRDIAQLVEFIACHS